VSASRRFVSSFDQRSANGKEAWDLAGDVPYAAASAPRPPETHDMALQLLLELCHRVCRCRAELERSRYGPFQKNCNVGQVANLLKTRQIGNLPHIPMLQYYWNGP
jgi:hypothetical protein